MTRRSRIIADTFGAASKEYEQKADVQRYAARQLASKLTHLPLPERPRVLELGCGSGLLSRHLLQLRPAGEFLFTDASPTMLQAAQQQLAPLPAMGARWFVVMDGERPAVRPGFDLITAGLAWQWFEEPLESFAKIAALLNPGGWLVCSTLGEKTFQEWRSACALAQLPCGAMTHPSRQEWEQHRPPGGQGWLEEESLIIPHDSAFAFLQGLQAIGANRSAPWHRPVASGALRRMLRTHQRAFPVSYQLYYLFFGKEPYSNSPHTPCEAAEAR